MLLFQKSAVSGPVLYGLHQVPHINGKPRLVRLIWRTQSWFYEDGFWDIDSRSWLVGILTTLLWQLLEPIGCIFQCFSPSNILKPRSWRFRNGAACHINAYSYAFYSHLKSKNGFSRNLTFGDPNLINLVSGAVGGKNQAWNGTNGHISSWYYPMKTF